MGGRRAMRSSAGFANVLLRASLAIQRLSSAPGACALSARRSSSSSAAPKVGFVTDVEGSLSFWQRYCQVSEVIDGDPSTPQGLDELTLHPGCQLVFGGDAVDKGPGDLRFLRSLLSLKARYPERVHFVMGNRDINKIRLLAELSDAHWLPAAEHPGVYWRCDSGPGGAATTPATFLASQPEGHRADSKANRLRYMLADNMGSPRAFEFRRDELRLLRDLESGDLAIGADLAQPTGGVADSGSTRSAGESNRALSDEEVLESYQSSLVGPDGVMRSYLRQARLAVRCGDVLFVHGVSQRPPPLSQRPSVRAISARRLLCVPMHAHLPLPPCLSPSYQAVHSRAIGFVPGDPTRYQHVDEWIRALNAFATAEVEAWCKDADSGAPPSWPGADDRTGFGFFRRPGGGLLSYGMACAPRDPRPRTTSLASVRSPPLPPSPMARSPWD